MLVVNRFVLGAGQLDERDVTGPDPDAERDFLARAEPALAALAGCPGFVHGELGRAADDPTRWCLVTRWASIGVYRRALGSYQVKIAATSYSRPHSRHRRPCTCVIELSPPRTGRVRRPMVSTRSRAPRAEVPLSDCSSFRHWHLAPPPAVRVDASWLPRRHRACPSAALDERVDRRGYQKALSAQPNRRRDVKPS